MVFLLVFLVVINATITEVDNRIEKITNMFSYGVRQRTVLWLQMGKYLLLGLVGTGNGFVLCVLMLHKFVAACMQSMFDNISLVVSNASLTVLLIV